MPRQVASLALVDAQKIMNQQIDRYDNEVSEAKGDLVGVLQKVMRMKQKLEALEENSRLAQEAADSLVRMQSGLKEKFRVLADIEKELGRLESAGLEVNLSRRNNSQIDDLNIKLNEMESKISEGHNVLSARLESEERLRRRRISEIKEQLADMEIQIRRILDSQRYEVPSSRVTGE